MQTIGLYIHTPFCLSKCPYCDFYSLPLGTGDADGRLDAYTAVVLNTLDSWAEKGNFQADTLYFGGGTPSLLGGRRLAAILQRADKNFRLFSGNTPEITLEANPGDDLAETLRAFSAAGGNRLSLGMQSADETELRELGRRHHPADVERTVADARAAGIANLSLDMMLAVPGQTAASAAATARQAAQLGAEHLSAYLLKIEPHTPFGQHPPVLPDDDTAADIYMAATEQLDALGYRQYEISNFARPGKESRHNLKYWNSEPYLGIGPAASSCLDGRRFTYPRDVRAFLDGCDPAEEPDDEIPTGSPEEYALLRLRLTAGLREDAFHARFGTPLPEKWRQRAQKLPAELMLCTVGGIALTRAGFLVSNALITDILNA